MSLSNTSHSIRRMAHAATFTQHTHTAAYTHCNTHTIQHTHTAAYTHCNTHTEQHIAQFRPIYSHCDTLRHIATHTHTATHTSKQHIAQRRHLLLPTHCNTLQHNLQHTHTATHTSKQHIAKRRHLHSKFARGHYDDCQRRGRELLQYVCMTSNLHILMSSYILI